MAPAERKLYILGFVLIAAFVASTLQDITNTECNLPRIQNGALKIYGRAIAKKVVVIGTYVVLECSPGYHLIGYPIAACLMNSSQLFPLLGTCTNDCEKVITIPNGRLLKTTHPDIFNVQCDPMSDLVGHRKVLCYSNGTWTTPGTCESWRPSPTVSTTLASVTSYTPLEYSNETFHAAAYYGQLSRIFEFLDNGTSVDLRDVNDTTPLMLAASNGNTQVSKLLLDRGANVNAATLENKTAIMFSMEEGYVATSEFLSLRGADINAGYTFTGLTLAAKNNQTATAKLGIYLGSNVNSRILFGQTALDHFARNNNLEMVGIMLTEDADVDSRVPFGETALMGAAERGFPDIVRKLIQRGAEVNATRNDGYTALMMAASSASTAPSMITTAQILLDSGASIDALSTNSTTALMRAANAGNVEMTKLLLNYRADPFLKNHAGQTALDIAKQRRNRNVEKLIADYILSLPYRTTCVVPTILRGNVYVNDDRFAYTYPDNHEVSIGTLLTLKCHSGYAPVADTAVRARCNDDGEWDRQILECQRITRNAQQFHYFP